MPGAVAILAVQRSRSDLKDAKPRKTCTIDVGTKSKGMETELIPRIRAREEKRKRPIAPNRVRPHLMESGDSSSMNFLSKTFNDGRSNPDNLQRKRAGVLKRSLEGLGRRKMVRVETVMKKVSKSCRCRSAASIYCHPRARERNVLTSIATADSFRKKMRKLVM